MTSTTPERMANDQPDRPDPRRPDPHAGATPAGSDPDRTTQFRPFGVNPASGSTDWDEPAEDTPAKMRHIVDRFDGAVGLFLLRVAVAVIYGIRGLQKIQHLDVTRQQLTGLGIPYPDVMTYVLAFGQFAIAWLLLLGIAVRVAGLGVAVVGVTALVFGPWRTADFFTAGAPGFTNELEFLLVGVGLALLGLGGGGWTVDRRFRRR